MHAAIATKYSSQSHQSYDRALSKDVTRAAGTRSKDPCLLNISYHRRRSILVYGHFARVTDGNLPTFPIPDWLFRHHSHRSMAETDGRNITGPERGMLISLLFPGIESAALNAHFRLDARMKLASTTT